MGAIGNVFAGNVIRRNFSRGAVERRVNPLIAMEQFTAGLTDHTGVTAYAQQQRLRPTGTSGSRLPQRRGRAGSSCPSWIRPGRDGGRRRRSGDGRLVAGARRGRVPDPARGRRTVRSSRSTTTAATCCRCRRRRTSTPRAHPVRRTAMRWRACPEVTVAGRPSDAGRSDAAGCRRHRPVVRSRWMRSPKAPSCTRPWVPMIGSERLSQLLCTDLTGGREIGAELEQALHRMHDEIGVRTVRAHAIFHDDTRVYTEVDGDRRTTSRWSTRSTTRCSGSGCGRWSSSASCRVTSRRTRPRPSSSTARSSRRRSRTSDGTSWSARWSGTWSSGTGWTKCWAGTSRCGTRRTSRSSGPAPRPNGCTCTT